MPFLGIFFSFCWSGRFCFHLAIFLFRCVLSHPLPGTSRGRERTSISVILGSSVAVLSSSSWLTAMPLMLTGIPILLRAWCPVRLCHPRHFLVFPAAFCGYSICPPTRKHPDLRWAWGLRHPGPSTRDLPGIIHMWLHLSQQCLLHYERCGLFFLVWHLQGQSTSALLYAGWYPFAGTLVSWLRPEGTWRTLEDSCRNKLLSVALLITSSMSITGIDSYPEFELTAWTQYFRLASFWWWNCVSSLILYISYLISMLKNYDLLIHKPYVFSLLYKTRGVCNTSDIFFSLLFWFNFAF